MRAALASHRAGPWSDPSVPPLKPDPHPQTPQQLEGYMCGKWNAVLHFLVGSADTGGFDEPAVCIVKHTIPCGLAERREIAEAEAAELQAATEGGDDSAAA